MDMARNISHSYEFHGDKYKGYDMTHKSHIRKELVS